MKKIFYSMMAVALCACSQSDVDEVVTPPQPENKGLKFEVVDNGFINEDGTRVSYGAYGSDNNGAYKATFEEDDAIGIYAIKSSELIDHQYGGKYPKSEATSYTVKNVKLTLKNGVWKSESAIDFGDADLLFAYAPYRADASVTNDYEPTFTGSTGAWAINTDNNRFFVGGDTYNVTDNSGDNFKANDWMGAAVNLKGGEQTITFNMQHMRGMVEVSVQNDVELKDLTLAIGSDNGTKYHFTPYLFAETTTQNVYRILTTEYRYVNTIYATIKAEGYIDKKYKKTPAAEHKGAGKCIRVNLVYTPEEIIKIGTDGYASLDAALTEKYGVNYATAPNPAFTSLRLAGTLKGDGNTEDWATLKSLSTLTSLDMYHLNNEDIPNSWLAQSQQETPLHKNLTALILPNKLKTIKGNALQFDTYLENVDYKNFEIELPASVTTIESGAFYYAKRMTLRIPENSQLQTIGNGAFWNIKGLYTDKENVNVLKIPTGVTTIAKNAFLNVPNKIVFQTATAPTAIEEGAFNGSLIYVPNKENYQGKFPGGNTMIVNPLPLKAENYTSPYTQSGDGSLAGLCDGNTLTHWHSLWAGGDFGQWGIYIDIKLPEDKEYSNLKVSYGNRNSGNNFCPKRVAIGVSDNGTDYTKAFSVESNLPSNGRGTKALDSAIAKDDNTSYKYVRFAFLEVYNNGENGVAENTTGSKAMAAIAELVLSEDAWTE